MARKKYEFKPDSTGSGVLSKLYLTQKQRKSMLKWTLYTLVCLVLLILQDVLMSRVRIFGATTDLVSCAILLICVIQGPESGGLFALLGSVIFLFSGSAPGPFTIVFLTVYGILAGIFRQGYLRKGLSSMVFCAFGALVLYEVSVFVIAAFVGHTTWERFPCYLLTAVYSLVFMPVLYLIFRSIGKIGGETWKE